MNLAPGAYTVQLHAIAWEDSPEWWVSEGTPTPAFAPADLVLRLGPQPGMILKTSVFERGDALVLRPCGPLDFRPVLDDMAGLAWHDRVEVRVVEVDPDARQFRAVLVRKSAKAIATARPAPSHDPRGPGCARPFPARRLLGPLPGPDP